MIQQLLRKTSETSVGPRADKCQMGRGDLFSVKVKEFAALSVAWRVKIWLS
ncbi:hypothetical protein D3C87_1065400 [compost metagenome]